jgi:hypothetical protein
MSETTVAIHQPNYLPWIGYFQKIHRSDVFVLLDDAEYSSRSWINRNKIKTPDGWSWLTVPVGGSDEKIRDVEITADDWRTTHLKSFQHNYRNADHYDEFADVLEDVYATEWTLLADLNVRLLREICRHVSMEFEFVRSSTLDIDATGTERLVDICEAVGGTQYLSGQGADGYMEEERFSEVGIELEYQSFEHPAYEQRFGEFASKLSFIDAVLNVGGDRAYDLLSSL